MPRKTSALPELLAIHTSSNGGSSDTLVKLFAVRPTGRPSGAWAVMMVTPVAKQPIASRNVRASEPERYSGMKRGCLRSRKSISKPLNASVRSATISSPPPSTSIASTLGKVEAKPVCGSTPSGAPSAPRTTNTGMLMCGAACSSRASTPSVPNDAKSLLSYSDGASPCPRAAESFSAETFTAWASVCAGGSRRIRPDANIAASSASAIVAIHALCVAATTTGRVRICPRTARKSSTKASTS